MVEAWEADGMGGMECELMEWEAVGGGGGGGMGLTNGAAFNILTVNVGRRASSNPQLGPLPPLSVHYDPSNVPNFYTPRPFTLEMSMMVWTINGRVYEMKEVAEDEMVTLTRPWPGNGSTIHPSHTPCISTISSSRWSSGRLPPTRPATIPPSRA